MKLLRRTLKILSRVLPAKYKPAVSTFKVLNLDYAHLKSVDRMACVDNKGKPIPWYTYPAIEYIKQIDWTAKTVFEYGCGNSTLFWAGLAKEVISIESDPVWYEKIRPKMPAHCQLMLEQDIPSYLKAIESRGTKFDVIILDGDKRFEAGRHALPFLADGGLVILDNSDWHPKTSQLLREANLIEVDMTGFSPINGYTLTTSFYFRRDFVWKPAGEVQPQWGVGSIKQYAPE